MLGCGFGFTSIHFGFAADPDDDERYFDEAAMMKVGGMPHNILPRQMLTPYGLPVLCCKPVHSLHLVRHH